MRALRPAKQVLNQSKLQRNSCFELNQAAICGGLMMTSVTPSRFTRELAASAAALLAVALAAVYLPVRRAALLDPLGALRQE
jgi:ABC-type lipoprotein release transport system permease subunit